MRRSSQRPSDPSGEPPSSDGDDTTAPLCGVCGQPMRRQPPDRTRLCPDLDAPLHITPRWTSIGPGYALGPWGTLVPAVWVCDHDNGNGNGNGKGGKA